MAITPRGSLRHQSRLSPLLRHGAILRIVPGNASQEVEIDRAPDSGGSPGTWANIDRVTPPPKAGFLYIDIRPFSTATWWYRCRQVGVGLNPGSYATAVSTGVRRLDDEHLMAQIGSEPTFARTEDLNNDAVTTPKIGPEAVTPPESQSRFRCRVRKSGGQVLNVSSTQEDVTWEVEDADVGSLHNNASDNERITIPTGGDTGFWILRANLTIAWNGAAVGDNITCDLVDNAGTLYDTQDLYRNLAAPDEPNAYFKLSAMVPAPAAGSWFKVTAVSTFTAGGGPTIAAGVGQVFFEAIHAW